MKIIETIGCMANDLLIDGKSISEFTPVEYDKLVEFLLLKIKEQLNDDTIILTDIIRLFQEENTTFGEVCDACDDQVTTTYYEL